MLETSGISHAFDNPVHNVQLSLLTLMLLVAFGTLVYILLENMTFTDALYMTIITITTVGFGEVQELSPQGRAFTILLILLGVTAATTAISNAISVVLGPRLWHSIRLRRLEGILQQLEDHYIICGYGRMGSQVARDLQARGESFVVVDQNADIEAEMIAHEFPYIIGDATLDDTLMQAGIERARGLVAALNSDSDNVMTVLSARELSRKVIIVARVSNIEAESKLRRAGANRVISPYQLGGHRIAVALIRPSVSDFLDQLYSFGAGMHIDLGQLHVRAGSRLEGQKIGSSDLRRVHNVNVLAIQRGDGEIIITPNPDEPLTAGCVLIVIGPPDNVYELEAEFERHS